VLHQSSINLKAIIRYTVTKDNKIATNYSFEISSKLVSRSNVRCKGSGDKKTRSEVLASCGPTCSREEMLHGMPGVIGTRLGLTTSATSTQLSILSASFIPVFRTVKNKTARSR
jgi:hypothetical protein